MGVMKCEPFQLILNGIKSKMLIRTDGFPLFRRTFCDFLHFLGGLFTHYRIFQADFLYFCENSDRYGKEIFR